MNDAEKASAIPGATAAHEGPSVTYHLRAGSPSPRETTSN